MPYINDFYSCVSDEIGLVKKERPCRIALLCICMVGHVDRRLYTFLVWIAV